MNFLDLIVLVALTMAIGLLIGGKLELDTSRDSAIEAGVGGYYLDDVGNKQFRFKECEE